MDLLINRLMDADTLMVQISLNGVSMETYGTIYGFDVNDSFIIIDVEGSHLTISRKEEVVQNEHIFSVGNFMTIVFEEDG